jgi:uncharacterized iron-regulated membrane protein
MRKAVFWLHLTLGLAAGLVLGMQAVTGGLLAYEPAILELTRPDANAKTWVEIEPAAKELPFRRWQLIRKFGGHSAQGQLSDGRLLSLPSATASPAEPPAILRFLATTKEIHRWFAAEGPLREKAKLVTGISAAVLIALGLSGLILWWPRTRAAWRTTLAFPHGGSPSKKWWHQLHIAVGFWLLLPILLAAVTGTLLAFPALLGPTPAKVNPRQPRAPASVVGFPTEAVAQLTELAPHWTELDLRTAPSGGWQVRIRPALDAPGFAQDALEIGANGELLPLRRYADLTALQKTKAWIRYAHTGEAFGLWGQTVALVTSVALLLLLWSGVTLSILRLRSWQSRRPAP